MGAYSSSNSGNTSELSLLTANLEEATDFVIERARQLVNRLVESRGREGPPFLAEELAPLQGIKEVVKANLGEPSALLFRLPDGYIIKVNSNHPQVRQNFSCAHEIGHTFLHKLENQAATGVAEFRTLAPHIDGWTKERLCDVAATELLMPESVFRKYLSGFGVSVDSIEPLAHAFQVSRLAVARRIAEVSQEPSVAILWERQQKTKSKGFRVAWCEGPGRKSRGISYYMPEYQYVRDPSTLFKAYQSDTCVKSYRVFEFCNTKKRCYTESKGFGYNERRYVVSLAFPER